MLRGGETRKQRSSWCGRNQNWRFYKELFDLIECSLVFLALADLCILPQELEDRLANRSKLCDEPVDVLQSPQQTSNLLFSCRGWHNDDSSRFVGIYLDSPLADDISKEFTGRYSECTFAGVEMEFVSP